MTPKDKNILYNFIFLIYIYIYIYIISKKEGNYLFKTQFRK